MPNPNPNESTRFKKGASGNPAGRFKSPGGASWYRKAQILTAQVFHAERIQGILEQLAQMCENGDKRAIFLVAERLLPPVMTDQPVKLKFPVGGSLKDKIAAIDEGLSEGEITPTQAARLSEYIKAQSDAVANAEATDIITALHEFMAQKKGVTVDATPDSDSDSDC